ncbi:MAG: dihydroxyacetone kinase phosphoryl donor subunit DhaM [Chloroflexales bacterium]
MIGLLIISHSAAIAHGVKALADQMAKGHVRIAAAGGTYDGALGTSADLISEALETLTGVTAVLALVDMGSAVMSAEMALEASGMAFLLSGAPLVEGALVAAVEALRPEATLAQVAAAAARALETKGVEALPVHSSPAADVAPPPIPVPAGAVVEVTLTVFNSVGLHMRPAKEFVQTAARFTCTVRVRNLDRPEGVEGNAKSIIDVLKLGVLAGQHIRVRAEGADADAAVAALSQLVAANFGETSGF